LPERNVQSYCRSVADDFVPFEMSGHGRTNLT